MPHTLGPLLGSNSCLLGREVTHTPPKGPDVLVGNIPAHIGAIDQELSLLAHVVHAPSIGTYAMSCDHTRVHTRHMPASLARIRPVLPRGSALILIVTPRSQIFLILLCTLSKTRTRTNPAYIFVLASRKRLSWELKCTWHLGLYISETHSQLVR